MDGRGEDCLSCGHARGVGRFCTSCGHPTTAPSAGPDAGSPQPGPRLPPPAYAPPHPARFPLFADESGPGASGAAPEAPPTPTAVSAPQPAQPASASAVPPAPPARGSSTARGRPRAAGPQWVAAALVVALIGVGGVALLNDSDPLVRNATGSPGPSGAASSDAGSDDGSESGSEPPAPGTAPIDAGGGDGEDGGDDPLDLTRLAEAIAPETAAPSRDVRGNAVRYGAPNMLDGQPDTAWRMPGDASGLEVVFRLPSASAITEVGLINGYAKVDPGYDGYTANRRILAVEWIFADGTVVPQDLTEDLALQSIPITVLASDTVTLRIVEVSEPAQGPTGRDYTAISDIALRGSTA